jgi:hypothetical protein
MPGSFSPRPAVPWLQMFNEFPEVVRQTFDAVNPQVQGPMTPARRSFRVMTEMVILRECLSWAATVCAVDRSGADALLSAGVVQAVSSAWRVLWLGVCAGPAEHGPRSQAAQRKPAHDTSTSQSHRARVTIVTSSPLARHPPNCLTTTRLPIALQPCCSPRRTPR